MNDIKDTLQDVFRDVFDDEDIVITPETTANDIDAWDSLTHVQLIIVVEQAFSIKFTTAEIMKLKNVGALISLIEKKRVYNLQYSPNEFRNLSPMS